MLMKVRIKSLNYWKGGGAEEAYKKLRKELSCTGPWLGPEA